MLELYPYQKGTVAQVKRGKHVIISMTGTGKTPMSLACAEQSGQPKVLVVTTASMRDSKSFEKEAEIWWSDGYKSHSSLVVISWATLAKWLSAHKNELENWYVIFDELDSVKAGISSQRGRAFLQLTYRTDQWTGWTATPGYKWIHYYPYFTACGLVKNKTEFKREHCVEQTYRGFPEIVAYKNEDKLRAMWRQISYKVDSSSVMAQLPKENNQKVFFKAPAGYQKVAKTSMDLNGEFLDNNSKYRHYLRKLCCSKQKLQWVEDFVRGLESPVIFMYNYVDEGELISETVKKAYKSKGVKGRIWRIDGSVHDIPTTETIKPHDVVLVQWASGSRGLNLQFINYWVSVTPCDGYDMSKQGKGRIRRIGQTKPQFYYYLICKDTLENNNIYPNLKAGKDFDSKLWAESQKTQFNFKWREENH